MNNSKSNVVVQRDGDSSPVTLDQDKCLIRTVLGSKQVDCCAIFNGPYGTALRSYTDNVLVNGEPTAVRWLNAGDEIQLPCSTRFEVKAATALQTIQPPAETQPAVEESFHSPFSEDLPEIVAPAVELGSASDAVVPQVEPATPHQADTQTQTEEAAGNELQAIFAKMGVANVGSIANPGSVSDPAMVGPPVADSAVADSVDSAANVENVCVDPIQEQEQPSDSISVSRQRLESIFGSSAPLQQSTAAPAVASDPATPEVESFVDTFASATVDSEATLTPPAVDLSDSQTMEVSKSDNQQASDPLAELPDDLRNQLNSLVSSLENESPASADSVELVEPKSEAVAVDSANAVVNAADPIRVEEEATEAKPVRDESISNMFADVMQAIQDESQATAPAAVESIDPVGSISVAAPEQEAFATESAIAESSVSEQIIEPEPEAEQMKPQSQSVADILGAMGMEVPGADEIAAAEPEAVVSTPEPTPAPAPAPAEASSVPSVQAFANMQSESDLSGEEAASSDAEDDIQAYMNKLLNRSSQSAPVIEPVAASSGVEAPQAVAKPAAESKDCPSVLSKEEFVPAHKPSRPENYDTLREIANTSSRSAIHVSNKKAQKESVTMKLAFGLISLLFAGGAFWLQTPVVSGVCLAITAMCVVSCFLNVDRGVSKKSSATNTGS